LKNRQAEGSSKKDYPPITEELEVSQEYSPDIKGKKYHVQVPSVGNPDNRGGDTESNYSQSGTDDDRTGVHASGGVSASGGVGTSGPGVGSSGVGQSPAATSDDDSDYDSDDDTSEDKSDGEKAELWEALKKKYFNKSGNAGVTDSSMGVSASESF
jgi:hypothetical protein